MSSETTIHDVARRVGVSVTTVSQALNGKRPVNKETKEKILKAVEELGYVPSWSASMLKRKKSNVIGCLATDITETFVNQIVKGIEKGSAETDLTLLFVSLIQFKNDEKAALNFLISHNVSGILFCQHIPYIENMLFFENSKVPVVSINQEFSNGVSILPDYVSAGATAAGHLVSCGVQHPAFIGGPSNRISSNRRYEGYVSKLNELGIDGGVNHSGEFSFSHGFNAAKRILSTMPKTDGLFCANDHIACGAVTAIHELGLRVPEQIKIIGFDNRDFSAFFSPPITTFAQPLEDMGILGVTILRDQIKTGISDTFVRKIPCRIIPRMSTGTYSSEPV